MLPELPELTYFRVLHGIELDAIAQLLLVCEEVTVPAGEVLMVEGEEDRGMALILEGVLEVYVGQEPKVTAIRRLGKGEHVGELSVLGLADRRSASVRVVERARLLIIEPEGIEELRQRGHAFVDNLEEAALQELAENLRETDRMLARLAVGTEIEPTEPQGLWDRLAHALGVSDRPWGAPPDLAALLKVSPQFAGVPGALADHLADKLEPMALGKGDKVIEEGQLGNHAYILAEGQVGVYRATRSGRWERVGQLEPGTIFGHLAIIDGALCTATCIMESPGWLFRVPKRFVHDVVHKHTPEARALRWGFLRALTEQLASANHSLAELTSWREREAEIQPEDQGDRFLNELTQARMAAVGPP